MQPSAAESRRRPSGRAAAATAAATGAASPGTHSAGWRSAAARGAGGAAVGEVEQRGDARRGELGEQVELVGPRRAPIGVEEAARRRRARRRGVAAVGALDDGVGGRVAAAARRRIQAVVEERDAFARGVAHRPVLPVAVALRALVRPAEVEDDGAAGHAAEVEEVLLPHLLDVLREFLLAHVREQPHARPVRVRAVRELRRRLQRHRVERRADEVLAVEKVGVPASRMRAQNCAPRIARAIKNCAPRIARRRRRTLRRRTSPGPGRRRAWRRRPRRR